MSAANSSVPIAQDLLHDVEQQALHDGVPVQEWIALALAERVKIERQTEEFFRQRAGKASGMLLGELLDKAPDVPPDPGDELPEGWKPS